MYLPSTSNDPENFSFSSLPVQQKTTSKAFSLSRTPPSDRDENQKSVLQFCSHPSGRHPAKISSRTSVGKYSVPAIFRAAMLTFLACIVKRTINGVELLLLLNSFTLCVIGVVVASRAEFSTFDSVRKTILKRFPRLDFYIGKLHVKRCWILTWVDSSDFKKSLKIQFLSNPNNFSTVG